VTVMVRRQTQMPGVAVLFALVCGGLVACDNAPPSILEVTLVSDTTLEAGPYEVRVVAFDDDTVTKGRIEWSARSFAGAPTDAGSIQGEEKLALRDDDADVDGQRLKGAMPGQRTGTEVAWSVVVCDAKGACARSARERFVVGARPSRPVIDDLTPDEGPESGGTRVTLHGTDFRPGALVRFGGGAAVNTEWISAELVLVTTPRHPAGEVDVEIENTDGGGARSPRRFSFLPAPLLTSVRPVEGPASGGTAVVLRGERFFEGVRVFFGGVPCRSLARVSEEELHCNTPPGAPGQVDVSVRHETRGFSFIPDAFLYVDAPRVDGVEPPAGPDTGGTEVVVVGTGFRTGADVFIDGARCTDVNVVSDTEITCVTPPGAAGVGDVLVVNPDGQDGVLPGGFDYEGPPVVVAVVPAEGPLAGGAEARVLGAGFRDTDVVRFAEVDAVVLEHVSDAELRVRVPTSSEDPLAPPPSGTLAVEVSVQRQDPIDMRAGVLPDAYLYFWPPEVTTVTPPRGPTSGGTAVLVEGRFFRDVQGETLWVRFDGTDCVGLARLSSTALACTTPPGEAGFADVDVENHPLSVGTGLAIFEYVPPPRVDAIAPREGPTFGGEVVTVTGAGFQDGALVFIDGAPCLEVTVVSGAELFCVTPPGEEGLADVRVQNPDAQEDTAEAIYEYLGVAVSPDHGTIAGFTRVRVRSAGMQPGAVITFGGVAADCSFVSSREFVCQTPAHVVGPVTVAFFNPDMTGEDGADAFHYRVLVDRTANRIDNDDNNANHVEAADLDADGDLDLVVANGAVTVPQQSFVFRNDGSGDFTRTSILDATANKVDLGDFDGDGRPDLVFAGTSGSGAHLFRNTGADFVQNLDVTASRGAFDAMLADLSGDTRDDVFVLTIGCDPFLDQQEQPNCDAFFDGLDVLLESTPNGFVDRSDLVPQTSDWTHDHKMTPTDLDLDGDLDIVIVVNNDPYVTAQNRVLRNRVDEGDGFVAETPADLLNLIGDLYDIVAGDVDGDGDEDIVTTICAQPFGSGEVILRNDAGALVNDLNGLPGGTEDCDVGAGLLDIDSDGDLDVLFGGTRGARYNLKLYINRGDGSFVDGSAALPSQGDPAPRLQVNHIGGGDLDGDGDVDLAIAAGAPYESPGQPGAVLLFLLE
jgi:IPT/TIG domain/FG-GAP-like repeat